MKRLFIILLIPILSFAQNQPRDQNVTAGEYFINIDPGEGNGISLSSTYGFAFADVSLTPLLSDDNTIYIRFKSSNGIWGPPSSFKYKLPLSLSGSILQTGEYFVNTNPGFGNASALSIGDNGVISLSSVLINRNDRVFLRVMDNLGRWGEATSIKYQYKNLINAEYKIKFKSGNITAWQGMQIQNQLSPFAYFTAVSNSITDIDINTIDTVFIHFQSEDYFWGVIADNFITDIKEIENNIPTEFSLTNSYPNPFNPTTKIRFDIPRQSQVSLKIFDILGREVAKLVNEEVSAGSYEYTWDARDFSSGVYFYRMQAGNFTETKKLILLR